MAAAGAFLKTLAMEPPIKREHPIRTFHPSRAREHLQIGVITQYANSLTRTREEPPEPEHGVGIQIG
jgi:hypothetical protein